MSDKLNLENYLLILKSTVEVFVHGTLESSNIDVRKTLKKCLDEILSSQANTYDLMSEYGWYTTSNVKASEVSKIVNKKC